MMITDWYIPILIHITSMIRVIVLSAAFISGMALAFRLFDYDNRIRKDQITFICSIIFAVTLCIGMVFPSWERVEMMIITHYSTPENISKFPSEDAFYNQLGFELDHTIYFKPYITNESEVR